jgi:hypothetical protein
MKLKYFCVSVCLSFLLSSPFAKAGQREVACGQQINSIGLPQESFDVDLGVSSGMADLHFDAYAIPDSVVIICNGVQIFSNAAQEHSFTDFGVNLIAASNGQRNTCKASVTSRDSADSENGTTNSMWSLKAICSPSVPLSIDN